MPEGTPIKLTSQVHLREHGWTLLAGVFDDVSLAELRQLTNRLIHAGSAAVREREGAVYAARNVLDLQPEIVRAWRTPPLLEFLQETLGPETGLVRGLYFDKPPSQTWALPWHKDLLIAVADDREAEGFSRPRLRAGVWHAEPPVMVLENMLTLRIHLDAMTDRNGPLGVLSGSHRTGKTLEIASFPTARITSSAGDVLAMRPLTVHSSGRSDPTTHSHRRVLHLEFSRRRELPGNIDWHTWFPVFE